MSACRCGHTGDGPHPCHGKGRTCGRPATRRLYNARPGLPSALPGMQMKVDVEETWGCDECWAKFKVLLDRAAGRQRET